MGNNLKEEFIDVIKVVTKDVSNEVIKNTTLKSLESHNQTLNNVSTIIKEIQQGLLEGQLLYKNIENETLNCNMKLNTL